MERDGIIMASGWSKDKRPARQRYWDRRTLEKRKVRHILANNQTVDRKPGVDRKILPPMPKAQAIRWWQSKRKGRVQDKYLPLTRSIV